MTTTNRKPLYLKLARLAIYSCCTLLAVFFGAIAVVNGELATQVVCGTAAVLNASIVAFSAVDD
jgi:hypothetical protein